jgi:hypothetical protein
VMIGLPGTRFVPSDFESRSLGGGDCLYNAIGNSMQNAGVSLFGPKTRNLAKKVKDMIAREIDNNKATKEAMNCRRGYWTTSEISRPEDYVKKKFNSYSEKTWGTSYDLHILVRALEKSSCNNQIVVYSYKTEQYVRFLALEENGKIPQQRLHASNLRPDDVVITNSGNTHWGPTRYDKNAIIGLFATKGPQVENWEIVTID